MALGPDVGKSAFIGFDDGAAWRWRVGRRAGTGAVECVQARHGKVGRVADVVQPRGSFH
jgi:hypothetical protein